MQSGIRAVAGSPKVSPTTAKVVPPTSVTARAPKLTAPRIEVSDFDASKAQAIVRQSTGSAPSSDLVVRDAFKNAQQVTDYYLKQHARAGYDGKGGTVQVTVHAPVLNAEWDKQNQRLWFSDGDTRFKPYGGGLDVMAHEFTHGVVDAEVSLSGDQGNALHESWADVMASAVDKDDWTIGEDVAQRPGDAVRDLQNPVYRNMQDAMGAIEQHDLSAVPSYAAYKVGSAVGREKMAKIWYTALTDHLGNNSGFSGAARATMTAAAQLYGTSSPEFAAVTDAWKGVGVDPHFKERHRQKLEQAQRQFVAG